MEVAIGARDQSFDLVAPPLPSEGSLSIAPVYETKSWCLPERFGVATSLADWTLNANTMDRLNTRYEEYSKVIFAMGCFFFCTGLQWSIYIGQSATYDEMKELCHHNERCNLAGPESINWMGLNPDMTWSNFVYFVSAGLIYIMSWYYRSPRFRAFFSRYSAAVAPQPEEMIKTSSESSGSFGANPLARGVCVVGDMLIGLSESTRNDFGLCNAHLPGMYQFAATSIMVEGALSALYHTCPSKTFQQFDYIGITTCEISVFLMLWTKCHPVVPTAGTMAMYVSMLGLLAAVETPLPVQYKPIVWIIFGCWIVIITPFVAATLNYGLHTMATPGELYACVRVFLNRGVIFAWEAIVYLGFIMLSIFVYIAVSLDTIGSLHALVVFGMYVGFMICVGLCFFLVARFRTTVETGKHEEDPLTLRQRHWTTVRLGLLILWLFFGLDHCIQGAFFPTRHNLSHAIMMWHGKGAALYYVQFYAGLFYFRMIEWRTKKFLRAIIYFVLMLLCCLLGGDYFVNGTYKANAEIKRFGIPCDRNGEADETMCRKGANGTNLDVDYPCGRRRGKYTCLVGSLDYNDSCSIVSGMDGHSLWHVFSALALFLLPMSLMVVDALLENQMRSEIAVI
eukprot:TRINITY_DN22470_c0_g1_i1.p1 TRINITY_DN22470_c0_g1~~TRINITY_DN22470_c0_g1_i1.p1  ORF type:complete len:622 (+),score=59.30 TRINITY_DN22470_c0_g1_i1:214-2079(+)